MSKLLMFRQIVSRWFILCLVVVSLILGPFFLFGTSIEVWAQGALESTSEQKAAGALLLCLFIGSDILLPIPSSLVSTAAGVLYGWGWGFVISLIGMTLSCGVGYLLGCSIGRSAAERIVGPRELTRLERAAGRYGDGVIVLFRAIPVLAEASVLFAGVSRMRMTRFCLLSTLSNIGIAAVYATVGTYAASTNSFLLAFAGAVLLPPVVMLLLKHKTDCQLPTVS